MKEDAYPGNAADSLHSRLIFALSGALTRQRLAGRRKKKARRPTSHWSP
jgi:hypothetical protein